MAISLLAQQPQREKGLLTKVAHGGDPQDRTFALVRI